MNARRRLQREIVRRRRREPWPEEYTRFVTPNGTLVRFWLYPCRCQDRPPHIRHAHFRAYRGTVIGPWPPTPELLRELGRWA